MNNKDILDIAMRQSAIDANCTVEDFCKSENIVVYSSRNENARRYLDLPLFCDLISYGNNIVASVDKEFEYVIREYINKYPVERCFETPNIHVIDSALQKVGMRICFMAEYFLPDINVLKEYECEYSIKLLGQEDFKELYGENWSNALSSNCKELDILGIGAYDGDKLIGLAACSADCSTMWQIGVDVLPEYRRKGIASTLTSKLAIEILGRGIVPFYCAAWSNIKSVRNAIKSGFKPAWIQLTAKSIEFVSKMNR